MSTTPQSTRRSRARSTLGVGIVAAIALLGACGDDDDGDDDTTPAITEAPTDTEAPAAGESSGENAELCALALEVAEQDFPMAQQLQRYQELAPTEIQDAVDLAAPVLMQAGSDPVAAFAAYAADDIEAAVAEINAWETEHCGVSHEEDAPLAAGASKEIEDDATRVDVSATDYAFGVAEPVAAGRTSFVLTNDGAEAHLLGILQLAEGVDLETALSSEDDSMIEGYWQTGVAAPGGEDEEAITFDLEPGTYGLVCWISAADGTPHAMMGMTKELTVT